MHESWNDPVRALYFRTGGDPPQQRALRERVHWVCRQAEGERVLDLCCGTGLVSILLARECFQVVGLDTEGPALDIAQQALEAEPESIRHRVRFEARDSASLASEARNSDFGTFDTVVLMHALEYRIRPRSLLAQAFRYLREGGRLVVCTPLGWEMESEADRPKQAFFVVSLLRLLAEWIEVEELEIHSNALLVHGRRRPSTGKPAALEDFDSAQLSRWLHAEEEHLRDRLWRLPAESSAEQALNRAVEKLQTLAASPAEGSTPAGEEEVQTERDRLVQESQDLAARERKALEARDRARKQAQRLEKQLSNAISPSSIRFRVGTAFFEALRSPVKAIKLPWTLARLFLAYRRQTGQRRRFGKLPDSLSPRPPITPEASPATVVEVSEPAPTAQEPYEARDVAVFLAINGGGLGHLTRCLSVARKLRRRSPATRIVFFTTSFGLRAIEDFDFEAYYFPPKVFRPDQTASEWNEYFARSLSSLVSIYRPSVLVFDGVSPYRGILDTLERFPEIAAVWISRGNWREPERRIERISRDQHRFEAIVMPDEPLAESVVPEAPWAGKVVSVPPILLLDRRELLPREEAVRMVGLQEDGLNVLIQLGAGNINDLDDPIRRTIRAIKVLHPAARVLVAESLIARQRQVVPEADGIVKEYPLSRFLRAFDLLVSAAGYNSVCEALAYGVPTLFLPNLQTLTDDQLGRVEPARRQGMAEVLTEVDEEALTEAVRRLTSEDFRASIRRRALESIPVTGGDPAAAVVERYLPGAVRNGEPLVNLVEEQDRRRALRAGVVRPVEPIRVAAILDEFSYRCFAPEATLLNLHADHWHDELDDLQPQLLLVESAWRGSGNSWRRRLESLEQGEEGPLRALIEACREQGIPTVFWNKDDPPNFEIFLNAARLFDRVFTSASTCVERYQQELGHDRVAALPFAAQPRLHNPVGSRRKMREVGFAGSWHRRYPDRQRQMEWILQPAFGYGLDIYDRMFGKNHKSREFPEIYQRHIRGSMPYDLLTEWYRHYKIFLNVNSVTNDPIMCPRRVFEILASGTCLVSSPAVAINSLLPDYVALAPDAEQTERFIQELLDSQERRERLEHRAVREVLTHHTYAARFAQIVRSIGLEALPQSTAGAVAAVVQSRDPRLVDEQCRSLERQSHPPDEILVLAHGEEVLRRWREAQESLPPALASRLRLLEGGGEADGHLTEIVLKATDCPRWLFLLDGHAYGSHYLEDLLLAWSYSFADVVGKGVYYGLAAKGPQCRKAVETAEELAYGGPTLVGASLFHREIVERYGLPSGDPTEHSLAYGVDPGEYFVYAADRFSHLRIEIPGTGPDTIERALQEVTVDDSVLWPQGTPLTVEVGPTGEVA